ncbi:MAG: hypothetical protein FVQ85_09245 [Planctomycetes bacterium]|nr:hypothetical protein [Planctomycetota bacterium]
MKLRIAASAAVGVVLIGILAWPLGAPPEPFGTVSLLTGTISPVGAIVLALLAFLAGFIAYFISWPYGREIGILAAPAGLAIWGIRSGRMVSLIRHTASADQPKMFAALRWEPLFWLAIVAAGFAGVLLAQKICRKPESEKTQQKSSSGQNRVNVIIALAASVLIAQLCISAFAQGVRLPDRKLGSVLAQPAMEQIVYAVFVSFGLAAFVVKKFLNVSYIWPIIATAFVTAFAIISHGRQDTLLHLSSHWPAVFFSHAAISILPVQMVSLGTLGSIAGYWMGIRYNYWRKHG